MRRAYAAILICAASLGSASHRLPDAPPQAMIRCLANDTSGKSCQALSFEGMPKTSTRE